ncbi:MAG TPA: phosphogluconate dehydratase [Gammaproteobacteria bacterium]
MNKTLLEITERIVDRSRESRRAYLEKIRRWGAQGPSRHKLGCANLAHGFAGMQDDRLKIRAVSNPNIGIVSAYNDMLSAHQPFVRFPDIIKDAVHEVGCTAQFAGGVPAMCDGVTQGQPGMELSLFSRDTIAMATAIALTHNMFDGALCLGICDKIVPGLVIGSLSFGHLPVIFVPGGPMRSGLPNSEKARIRNLFAQGKVGREELLEAEAQSYHEPGTCTFYGTANSNQMMMEMMGLHLPGASFVNPNTPLRDALTRAAAQRVTRITKMGDNYMPMGEVVDEKAIVNALVGLMATGGSTNHTLHLVAMAKAAGVLIDWDDFADVSRIVPLLTRIYPNGQADVNHFHAAGGMAFLIGQLLDAGLLHGDINTVAGKGLDAYRREPFLDGDKLVWRDGASQSLDTDVLRPVDEPFSPIGGLELLTGNIGRAVIKISAVKPEHQVVEAPAVVFHSQHELQEAIAAGKLERDFIAVVRFQGPKANGMPELHRLTPYLSVQQDKGFKVGLLTDGRMSGASGKVPAAIHITPEALDGGAIARLRDGDVICLNAREGTLEVKVSAGELARREPATADLHDHESGLGRELFAMMRRQVGPSEAGASFLFGDE